MVKKKAQSQPDLKKSGVKAKAKDVLELDELWSFVGSKKYKRWVWIALCPRTRQVVSFVIGDRSAKTCARLYNKLPDQYKQCRSFSDYWQAYAQVFRCPKHQMLGKESGQTNHIERFNNTLRQRLGRFVRKSLSFSKKDSFHHLVTKLFIFHYNTQISVHS